MGAARDRGMTMHSAVWSRLALLGLAAVMLGGSAAPASDAGCVATGELVPYCGLSHPEDIEVLPEGSGVIVSDMHIAIGPQGLTGQRGTLKWFDPKTRAITVLYPAASVSPGRSDWGDPACPGEIGAALLPHGFHLSRRTGGAWQLLVVNHGGRESVEFFELARRKGQWSMSWRGCVVPPQINHLNDVAALPDGGLLMTTMHRTSDAETRQAMRLAEQGKNTGFLWRWMPGKGFTHQAGSDSPMPNGVQVDAAGRYAYLNTANKGGDVRKLDLARGVVVGTVSLPNPDNASWAADGRLLVTGMAAGANNMACFMHPAAPCQAAFNVFAVDPVTMQADLLFTHSGLPLGGGTVAVQYGLDILIGSFAGDRIMAVRGFFKPGSHRPVPALTQSKD
jgi:hypothetical protein